MKNHNVEELVKMKERYDRLAERNDAHDSIRNIIIAYGIIFTSLTWQYYDMDSTVIDDVLRIGLDCFGGALLLDTIFIGDRREMLKSKINRIYEQMTPELQTAVDINYAKVKMLKK